MNLDLPGILKLLARAILRMIAERQAKGADPPATPTPAAPTVEVKAAVRPSDRVVAALVDLKLGGSAKSPGPSATSEGIAAVLRQTLVAEARPGPASRSVGEPDDADRLRQAAIDTQNDWRIRRVVATITGSTEAADPDAATRSSNGPAAAAVLSAVADAEIAQAQAGLAVALEAYRALETA